MYTKYIVSYRITIMALVVFQIIHFSIVFNKCVPNTYVYVYNIIHIINCRHFLHIILCLPQYVIYVGTTSVGFSFEHFRALIATNLLCDNI